MCTEVYINAYLSVYKFNVILSLLYHIVYVYI